MSTENHVNESILNDEIKEWQKKNRIDHMTYLKGMEVLESDVQNLTSLPSFLMQNSVLY